MHDRAAESPAAERAAGVGAHTDPNPTWLAIVNPMAGRSRRDARAWSALERALRVAALRVDVAFTTRPGEGEEIAAEALQSGRNRFLVAGGDGSAHDVVNGLMRVRSCPGPAPYAAAARVPTIVPLPLGTGNDWSRSLRLPRDAARLAAIIARDDALLHDVGRIVFPGTGTTDGTTRWFINVAGAGFDAHVIQHLPARTPGGAGYLAGALRALARYRASEFRISTHDGQPDVAGRLLLAFVANGQFCGGRMHVAPDARLDDGRLDLVTIDAIGLLRALPRIVKLYRGTLLRDALVRHRLASRLTITADPPAAIEADGQLVGRTPAEFSIITGTLRTLRGP